jgi:hypothetical protein
MGQQQSSFSKVPTDIAISFGSRTSSISSPLAMRRVFIEETMQPVTLNINIRRLQLATIEAEDVLRLAFLSLKHATGRPANSSDDWLRMTFEQFLEAVQTIQYVQNSKYKNKAENTHAVTPQRFKNRRTYVNVMLSFEDQGLAKILHRLSRRFSLSTKTGGKPMLLSLAPEDLPPAASHQNMKITLSWTGTDTLLFDRDRSVRVDKWKEVDQFSSESKNDDDGAVTHSPSVSSMISSKLGSMMRNPREMVDKVKPALSMVSALLKTPASSSGDSEFEFSEDSDSPESPSVGGIKSLTSMLKLFQSTKESDD